MHRILSHRGPKSISKPFTLSRSSYVSTPHVALALVILSVITLDFSSKH